ncbi:GDSL-type esterase/lipase family protein [Lyngbya confervoides BDU141951]|uniref:GDSL-type esterase/lipase family protein n=2 Tax=Lyngbya TaxID=28073 RepID=A0ABD4SYH9_9CYAN|nr:GDSL-type esterase/lipase family protein [Lyngbya confervoides]MCM1981367.1 GDSL-type esterase/lipase family protein [Lyngbya confervoides BDU141951]
MGPPPPKVVAIGDSLTYGYGDPVGGGWVDRLKRDWMSSTPSAPVLYNLGVRGDTIAQIHHRFEFEFQQRGELRHRPPQTLIFSFGVNDSARLGHSRGRHRTPFEAFQGHLGTLLDQACQLAQVLFVGMVPVDERQMPFMDAFFLTQEDQYLYKEATRLACQERQVPYLDVFEIWRQRGADWLVQQLCDDGLHPNSRGYLHLYQDIVHWPALERCFHGTLTSHNTTLG